MRTDVNQVGGVESGRVLEVASGDGEISASLCGFSSIGGASELEDCAELDEVLSEPTEEEGHKRLYECICK